MTLRCFFVAWIFGWVVAIYAPSAAIVAAGLSPETAGRSFPIATFAVADEVAPLAKIGFALLLAGLLAVARKVVRVAGVVAALVDICLATVAMLLLLAFLPSAWSRGFGVGLTGERFQPGVTALYLAGAAFAGLLFNLSEARCLARRGEVTPP